MLPPFAIGPRDSAVAEPTLTVTKPNQGKRFLELAQQYVIPSRPV
jgi:hypothetical protein